LFGKLPALLPASAPRASPSSTAEALSLIRSQTTASTGIYCLARLHSRTYLLHPRDILTLPTLKPAAAPGSTLQLTRILEVGSREFAIRSPAANGKELRKDLPKLPGVDASFETIPAHIASCQLTVLEHTKSPLTRTILKKRRKGYRKTIQNKQGWTRLRVGDIVLGDGVAPKA
jgi:large subunit ribosomal protein L21